MGRIVQSAIRRSQNGSSNLQRLREETPRDETRDQRPMHYMRQHSRAQEGHSATEKETGEDTRLGRDNRLREIFLRV